mmetsp:Transcript_26973/g.62739  ORF Transcript_26973/g.62739 Transcript_26973/m.62739 type:complete len:246 (+) Transcript_26973:1447-2184(+)
MTATPTQRRCCEWLSAGWLPRGRKRRMLWSTRAWPLSGTWTGSSLAQRTGMSKKPQQERRLDLRTSSWRSRTLAVLSMVQRQFRRLRRQLGRLRNKLSKRWMKPTNQLRSRKQTSRRRDRLLPKARARSPQRRAWGPHLPKGKAKARSPKEKARAKRQQNEQKKLARVQRPSDAECIGCSHGTVSRTTRPSSIPMPPWIWTLMHLHPFLLVQTAKGLQGLVLLISGRQKELRCLTLPGHKTLRSY